MLLAIDVGNTQTVIGLFLGDSLSTTWRIATIKHQTEDEVRISLSMLFDVEGIDAATIDGIAIASVVPSLTKAWNAAITTMFGLQALNCSAQAAGDLFPTAYPNPHEIGADRVADSIAAKALYGAPVIVCDFGTATNIEVVDKDGVFVGGILAAGLETSSNALFDRATRLAAIELCDPQKAIGCSTAEALRSGIVYGEADRADGLVRRVFNELGYKAPVVATGGLAATVARHSQEITEVNPELTLIGLRLLFESCNSESCTR